MSTCRLAVAVALFGLLLGVIASACSISGEKQNVAMIERHLEEVWHNKNFEAIDEMLTENYVRHMPAGRDVRGREAYVESVKQIVVPSPDTRFTMDLVVSKGDYVVVRYVGSGTHTAEGPLGPPTGKKWNLTSIIIHRFENGKMAECWAEWDNEHFLRQLGRLPEAK